MLKMLKKMALFPLALYSSSESLPFNIDGFPNMGRMAFQAKGENSPMYNLPNASLMLFWGAIPEFLLPRLLKAQGSQPDR